jgi:hypothetical protein
VGRRTDFALVAKWALVLMPVHVVLLQLIIDPARSVAFEVEPRNLG